MVDSSRAVSIPPSALTQATAKATSTGADCKVQLKGRVLCVDDNREVSEFVVELLTGWGLEVTSFDDSRRALAEVGDHLADFDLVLLDQTMPQLTGLELAREFKQRLPALPVLLYTGYSDQLNDEVVKAAGIHALIKKPLDIPHFRRIVEGVLGPSIATKP